MSEPETLTVYLELDAGADAAAVADQLRGAVAELPGVESAATDVEDVERSAVEVLESITLVVTAAGGVVGATTKLLGDVTKLIKTVKGIRAAWRETEDEPAPIDLTEE